MKSFDSQVLSHHLKELIGEYGMESILFELDEIVRAGFGAKVSYLEKLCANLQKTLSDYQRRNATDSERSDHVD